MGGVGWQECGAQRHVTWGNKVLLLNLFGWEPLLWDSIQPPPCYPLFSQCPQSQLSSVKGTAEVKMFPSFSAQLKTRHKGNRYLH